MLRQTFALAAVAAFIALAALPVTARPLIIHTPVIQAHHHHHHHHKMMHHHHHMMHKM